MFQFLASGLCGFLMGCVTLADRDFNYPDQWWAPVPAEDLKSWEIPPQAADRKKNEVILSKRTELGVFSNLAPSPFQLDGLEYASVEGFWQSLKFPEDENDLRNSPEVQWLYTRAQVRLLSDFEAKKAGNHANENMKKLGLTWQSYQGQKFEPKSTDQEFHYQLIFKATEAKVLQNEKIKNLLIKTGDLKLRPDHDQGNQITPAYDYPQILMKIRAGL